MDTLLHTRALHELWHSTSDMVRCILGSAETDSVEASALSEAQLHNNEESSKRISNAELHEALDELHDCLATSRDDGVRVGVRKTYLLLCRALLKVEYEHRNRLNEVIERAQKSLNGVVRPLQSSLPQLQETIKNIRDVASQLKSRAKNVVGMGLAVRLLLLADQAITGLRLLLRVVRELELGAGVPLLQIKAGVHHVLARLRLCMQESAAVEGSTEEDEEVECGQFVRLVDRVLGLLDNAAEVSEEARASCEEILSHAMSVAHVAVANDAEAITNVAQMVLSRVQAARKEEDVVLKALRVGSLEDAVFQLEGVVNTALLRLVLEVFSDVCAPLDVLLETYGDNQVAAFDLHVDRVMQAGLFAAACSSDSTRVAGVRSCLASLESLETELVPSLNTKGSLQIARFYASHWRQEACRLSGFLDQMVDPAAFCQVTSEELDRLQDLISNSAESKTIIEGSRAMVKHARKLLSLLSSLQARGEVPACDTQSLEDITFYTNELNAASKCNIENDKWKRRTTQRGKLLGIQIRALAMQLQDDTASSGETIASRKSTGKSLKVCDGEREVTPVKPVAASLYFPDSVRDLPLDIATPEGAVDLTPFVARGRRLCDARSVLYRTPQRSNFPLDTALQPINILATENDINHEDDTLDINLTAILDGLSGLSDTLSSVISEEPKSAIEPRLRNSKIGASLRLRSFRAPEQASNKTTTMCSPSLASQVVSASEREADLRFLEEKIEKLKLAINTL